MAVRAQRPRLSAVRLVLSGHFRRDLLPTGAELRPRHILGDIWNHIRLRRPRGEAARRYNVLQKLAYMVVVFVLLPVMVLTGLTMSPAVTAAMPFLFDMFGGRQSARTIHFLVANLLVLFVLVHVVQVVLSGVFNNMRSMITGRYAIRPEDSEHDAPRLAPRADRHRLRRRRERWCRAATRSPNAPSLRWILDFGQFMSLKAQRLLLAGQPLVREYAEADISPEFPPNGTERPNGMAYFQIHDVELRELSPHRRRPGAASRLSLTLDEIKALPSRTQITMHNCDEGWSAIGQWTGVPLAHLLGTAELKPEARYIVFHCIDEMVRTADGSGFYYESIDLFDAMHPQTILAYGMNGKALPVAHGAPLRLRVERQIGYKHAKFVNRIEAVDRLNGIARGKGGFWEDRGYQWYAGQ